MRIFLVLLSLLASSSFAQVTQVCGPTWLSNGNLFGSQYSPTVVSTIIADAAGLPALAGYQLSSSDFDSSGTMTWYGANAWVNYLNVIAYGGSSKWALPTTMDASSSNGYPNGLSGTSPGPNGSVPNAPISSSQMAQLFVGQLGEMTGSPITSTNSGFNNLQSYAYWSGTPYSAVPGVAWDFNTLVGSQGGDSMVQKYYALAVAPSAQAQVSSLQAELTAAQAQVASLQKQLAMWQSASAFYEAHYLAWEANAYKWCALATGRAC